MKMTETGIYGCGTDADDDIDEQVDVDDIDVATTQI